MITVSLLSFILIILAIGYGVGYSLLVAAEKQDRAWMVNLGLFFGWLLITLSLLISLMGIYFHITQKGSISEGCPMSEMMKRKGMHQPPYYEQDGRPQIKNDEDAKGEIKDEGKEEIKKGEGKNQEPEEDKD